MCCLVAERVETLHQPGTAGPRPRSSPCKYPRHSHTSCSSGLISATLVRRQPRPLSTFSPSVSPCSPSSPSGPLWDLERSGQTHSSSIAYLGGSAACTWGSTTSSSGTCRPGGARAPCLAVSGCRRSARIENGRDAISIGRHRVEARCHSHSRSETVHVLFATMLHAAPFLNGSAAGGRHVTHPCRRSSSRC
jgi:hypothetical protein